jgi:hypothetical protein
LLIELGGIELGEWLAFFHLVVGIHIDFLGGAGEFAADDDLVGGSEVACGGDDEGDAAAGDWLGDVFQLGWPIGILLWK